MLVVSPLVALMIDQVQILPPTRAYSLLFCAPDMPKWRDALDSNGVFGRIVSHRSKDYRQDYGRLAELRSLVRPGTPFMACTAIASGLFRTGTLSLECLAKSLKDLMSKAAFSRGTRRVWHILHMTVWRGPI